MVKNQKTSKIEAVKTELLKKIGDLCEEADAELASILKEQ